MITSKALWTTDSAGGTGTYNNERHSDPPLLPERFGSSSVPVDPPPTVLELGVGDQYERPVSQTPVVEIT
jgi:hypothetical protein